jgi:hypothetical protein
MHGCTNVQKDRDRNGKVRSDKRYTYRRYICGKYNSHGRLACKCNTIPERQILGVVVRKIQNDFLGPVNLAKLRAAIRRQLEARCNADPNQEARLKSRLSKLDQQISRGAERLLAAPADLTDTLTRTLRDWQGERQQVMDQLAAYAKQEQDHGKLDEGINRAMKELGTLHQRIDKANPAALREVLGQMISRVDCWFDHVPYGKAKNGKAREASVLSKGEIRLRPDLVLSRLVPSAKPLMTV